MKAEELKKYDVVSIWLVSRISQRSGTQSRSPSGIGILWHSRSVVSKASQGLQEKQCFNHGEKSYARFSVVQVGRVCKTGSFQRH